MIGRIKERNKLLEAFNSTESEFVAVYGRRRVGKTFLVRETFGEGFAFQHAGVKNGSVAVQLSRFRQSLVEHGHAECPELKNWFENGSDIRPYLSEHYRQSTFQDRLLNC